MKMIRKSSRKRGVADIPFIERILLLRWQQLATIDLSPAGNSWADRQSYRRIGRLIAGEKRAWTYQRHVPDKHVEQLRTLQRGPEEPLNFLSPLTVNQLRALVRAADYVTCTRVRAQSNIPVETFLSPDANYNVLRTASAAATMASTAKSTTK